METVGQESPAVTPLLWAWQRDRGRSFPEVEQESVPATL